MSKFRVWLSLLVGFLVFSGPVTFPAEQINYSDIITTDVETYTSQVESEPNLDELQCPIPMECRVRNHTGSQCVFSSLEMLARWAECKELLEPDLLTDRPGCRSYSGPSHASGILDKYGVKYENVYGDREKALLLIKKAMAEGRGCLFSVPGHAMVLVHYDEKNDKVCWVDNSDKTLKVQTMTISKFNQRWGGWVMVIYAKPDIVQYKVGTPARKIPIVNHSGPPQEYPKDFIPLPKR